ncbi:MAG: hypothetical protein ACFFCW_49100, partial [Candidatus Hodarchaeota archaeon]
MSKVLLEKTIIEEIKDLPFEALNEILDFIKFIKAKKIKNLIKDSIEKTLSDELSELNTGSLTHLEEEFANYKEHYPHEK